MYNYRVSQKKDVIMYKKIISITGATGNMGIKVVKALSQLDNVKLRLLVLDTKKERRLAKALVRSNKQIEILYGNILNSNICDKLVNEADYVINMAAVIPPEADKKHNECIVANIDGVQNIVKSIIKTGNKAKLIHISSVAIYGNRDYKHPWGRVGDPLLPSAYDVYGMTKLFGERMVLDSDINNWFILRQTGILYDKLLMKNISDGLMFHTCFNTPIEWVTDDDSATLIKNIILSDISNELKGFWKKVYNIGGGKNYRTTGYDTFDIGFSIIGGNAEQFMKPEWQATRNFHCMWFEDSKELQDRFHFQSGSLNAFWQNVLKHHKYFSLAKTLPPTLIRKIVIERLLSDNNSPYKWVKTNNEGRITAFFKSIEDYNKLKIGWNEAHILSKGQINNIDYFQILDADNIVKNGFRLNHGFDENKPITELDIDDMKKCASFRGGECLSSNMVKGDLYTKLTWKCSEGHIFEASPYTVLFAGHWCKECLNIYKWNFDKLAEKNPFYAQIWFDTHDRTENNIYFFDEFDNARMIKGVN